MKILGINFGHDSAVAYIENGQLIYALEEEKASRIKQDFGFPRRALEELFKIHGLNPKDIDIIAYGGNIFSDLGKNEIKYCFSKRRHYKNLEIINRITAYAKLTFKKISPANALIFHQQAIKLGFSNSKTVFYNHHLSHAASAYYCAPFKADLVITADGYGDGDSFNFYVPSAGGNLECIRRNGYEHSVGQFYSSITQLLGFRPTRHEGKITGLAAYGKPTELIERFHYLFQYIDNRLIRFPNGYDKSELWKSYRIDQNLRLRDKINLEASEAEIGSQYGMNALIMQAWLKENTKGFTKEDIAYACQLVSEKVILEEITLVYQQYFKGKTIKVALAGGVFANVRINQAVYNLDFVENIFIQPAMGDSGLALGAAILADIEFNSGLCHQENYRFSHTFWGPDYQSQLETFIQLQVGKGLIITKMSHPAKAVAQMIANNKIVGFWNGKMEWGPRALGSRSILLNTFDRSVNDSLNKRLNRTEFMPFAPAVLAYKAKEYFPLWLEDVPAADYMTITYNTAVAYHDLLQAVVHVDGTARPQIVRRNTTPYYFDILDEFYKLTNCGAVGNTSFNTHEEPIISTPEVALKALETDRIDILILGNYSIEKPSLK